MQRSVFFLLAALVFSIGACSPPTNVRRNDTPIPAPTALPTALPATRAPAAPVPTNTPPPPTIAPLPVVELNGVRLENTLLGVTARAEVVEAAVPIPETPPGDEYPAHIRISFDGYAPDVLAQQSLPAPAQVNIYPTGEFASYGFDRELNKLMDVFANRPDLRTIGQLPFLPPPGAEQAVRAQGRYLDFGGGKGIRYLVGFVRNNSIVPDDLFYTFQGLTDDGLYYVTATFPISTPILTETLELQPAGIADPNNARFRVLERLNRRLNALDPLYEITPPLSELDAQLQRLTITPNPAAQPLDTPEIRMGAGNGLPGMLISGDTTVVLEQSLAPGAAAQFRVAGEAGQALAVELEAPPELVQLAIHGIRSNLTLIDTGGTRWAGALPAADDYLITINSTAPDTTLFRLRVTRPQALTFLRSSTLAKANGLLRSPDDSYHFVLDGRAGQRVQIALEERDVVLTVRQFASGLPAGRNAEDVLRWSGTLPADGLYLISVNSDGGLSFTLEVTTEAPRPTPAPVTPTLPPPPP